MNPSELSTQPKTIAIWHPYFLGGGAEAVALWALAALTNQYAVTIYTCTDLDIDSLNAMYGTQLVASEIEVKSLFPTFLAQTINKIIANSKVFRMVFIHLLIKQFKQVSAQYDLALSTYNATDLGCAGMQYIHWVKVIEGSNKKKLPYWHTWSQKLSQFSRDAIQDNISLANSHYVAQCIEKTYSLKSRVIYPPVVAHIDDIPWESKDNAFICSGRIVRAKQVHEIIAILKSVREQGFDINLHITGGGGDIYDEGYQNLICKLVEQNKEWIFLHENLPYAEYLKLMSKCRYGIHYKAEPFGISIAEMVKAGLIPFVRKKGGQVEIVGDQNETILFDKSAEAITKITQVLESVEQQKLLTQALQEQKKKFSIQAFVTEMEDAISDYFMNHSSSLKAENS